jgi:hypothetical protein
MDQRVKITGGPEKTVTWIWLDPEMGGQLKIEYYDFSETAQRMFGNDIAYTITVNEMEKLHALTAQDEASLIPWMQGHFRSYFDIKTWLEENAIQYTRDVEPWA